MQENRKHLLKKVYVLCFSALTVAVGLLFIVQIWSIFRSAERGAFTVARISEHFRQIAVPVICWGLALFVNVVLGYVYPDAKERAKPYFETEQRIKRLQKRLPAQERKVDVVSLVAACVATAFTLTAAVFCFVYLFDKTYAPVLPEAIFTEHNGVTDRLVRVLVWGGGATMLVVAAVIFLEYRAKKREAALKAQIAENARQGKKAAATKEEKKEKRCSDKAVWYVRAAVGALGVALLIWGICNGGMLSVLEKAINICTQCIGLG